LVYYKENLNVIPKPEIMVNNIEALWLEITITSQRLLIGNVYRPPDKNEFYNEFNRILEQLWLKRNNMLIMGDFNSDLLKTNKDKSQHGRKLQRIIKTYGQFISDVTGLNSGEQ
jgi:exonuclease III